MSKENQPRNPQIEPFERAKELFLDKLSEEQRHVYGNATPENLFYQANVIHRGYQRASKLQSCRTALMPLVRIVEGYGSALDTWSNAGFVNTFMAPIWGSLRVVIHMAQEVDQYFEQLIEMLSQIGTILPQFRDYHRLFPQFDRLMLALSENLANILTFCYKVKVHFADSEKLKQWPNKLRIRHGSWKKISLSIPDYLEDFRKARKLIEKEALLAHMIEGKEHRDRQEDKWALQYARSREQRLQDALSVLSKVNYKNQHRELQRVRHAGSGEWLIEEQSLKKWLAEPASGFFHCFGIPGAGKSILASSLVNHLAKNFSNPDDFFGYYFCDYADPGSLKCSTLLGTLIRQVLDLSPRPESLVQWIIDNVGEAVLKPTTDDLTHILKDIFAARKQVFLVVDGIDELDAEEQSLLRTFMKTIISLQDCSVKIFISCRPGVPILGSFSSNTETFTISPEHVRKDILCFVKETVEAKLQDGDLRFVDPSLKDEVINTLSTDAKEMFLWVKFQITELCSCLTDAQIRDTLQNLPRDLASTYARIIRRILQSEGGDKKIDVACAAFRWIICSTRMLHIDELFEALAIKESDLSLCTDRIMTDRRKFVQACGNLITIQFDGAVRLAHHTVQQFLLRNDAKMSGNSNWRDGLIATNAGSVETGELEDIEHVRFLFQDADRWVGHLCLAYLHFTDFEAQIAKIQTRIKVPQNILPPELESTAASGLVGLAKMSRGRGPDHAARKKTAAFAVPEPDSLKTKFKFLEYARSSWAFHLNNFEIPREDEDMERVASIALDRNPLFQTRPWTTSDYIDTLKLQHRINNERIQANRLLFYWAIEHDVGYLLDVLRREQPMDFGAVKFVHPSEERKKKEIRGHFNQLALYEIMHDRHQPALLERAASWGANQVYQVLRILFENIDNEITIPFILFYRIIEVSTNEVRQVFVDAISSSLPYNFKVLYQGRFKVTLDSDHAEESTTTQNFSWYRPGWGHYPATPVRIFRQVFLTAFPNNVEVMDWAFPLLDYGNSTPRLVNEFWTAHGKYPAPYPGLRFAENEDEQKSMICTVAAIGPPGNMDHEFVAALAEEMRGWSAVTAAVTVIQKIARDIEQRLVEVGEHESVHEAVSDILAKDHPFEAAVYDLFRRPFHSVYPRLQSQDNVEEPK
ncbi:hypothetical protein IWX49DRAFT_636079 [Phyllosticta citricarpa]